MKYSLCLETLFEDMDMCDRIAMAKEMGYDAAEFWEPEKFDAKKIGKAASDNNIPISACCVYDTRNTTFNSAYPKIEKSINKTIEIASEFGCKTFIGLAGNVECKADSQKSVIIENLKRAGEICTKHGVTLVLEALNSVCDHLGYYLDSSYVGFEIIKAVNCPNIKLLYDVYHMQLMEGNVINNITKNTDLIGHIHSAGVPGRHEVMGGEVNYRAVAAEIEKTDYSGYFGFEYFPTYDSKKSAVETLAFMKN